MSSCGLVKGADVMSAVSVTIMYIILTTSAHGVEAQERVWALPAAGCAPAEECGETARPKALRTLAPR